MKDPEMRQMLKDHFPAAMSGKEEEGADDVGAQIMEEAAKLDKMAGKEQAKEDESAGEEKGEEKADKERVYRLLHRFGDPSQMSPSDKMLVGPANFKKMEAMWAKMSPEERTACSEGEGKMPAGAVASESTGGADMGESSDKE